MGRRFEARLDHFIHLSAAYGPVPPPSSLSSIWILTGETKYLPLIKAAKFRHRQKAEGTRSEPRSRSLVSWQAGIPSPPVDRTARKGLSLRVRSNLDARVIARDSDLVHLRQSVHDEASLHTRYDRSYAISRCDLTSVVAVYYYCISAYCSSDHFYQ
jgi:hypothetical protein